jgi:hypothetical protein
VTRAKRRRGGKKKTGRKAGAMLSSRPPVMGVAAPASPDAPPAPPPTAPSPQGIYSILPADYSADWGGIDGMASVPQFNLDAADDYRALLLYSEVPGLMVDGATGDTLTIDDMLRKYLLLTMGSKATSTSTNTISVVRSGPQNATKIDKLVISCLVDDASLLDTHRLTFSTDVLTNNFATDIDASKCILPSSGIFIQKGMIALGFVPETAAPGKEDHWKLTDIIKYMGQNPGAVATFLDALLESGEGQFLLKKGMIWHCALGGKRTTMRLEWQLDPTVVANWLSWLPTAGTPAKCSLVGKRTSWQIPDQDSNLTLLSESEFIAVLESSTWRTRCTGL